MSYKTFEQGTANIRAMHQHRVNIGANHCKERTHDAFDVPSNGTPTAYKSWLSIPLHQRVNQSNPSKIPKAQFVYFSGGSKGSGHVGVLDEDGVFWSPGGPSDPTHWTPTTVAKVLKGWPNLRLVGYSEMIDGVIPARTGVGVVHSVPLPTALKRPKPQPKGWGGFFHAPDSKTWRGDSIRGVQAGARRAKVGKPGRAVDINTPGTNVEGIWIPTHWLEVLMHGFHNKGPISVSLHRDVRTLEWKIIAQFEAEPKSKVPYPIRSLLTLLAEADRLNVRVELEIKHYASLAHVRELVADPHVKSLLKKHLLVVKTLAAMPGSVSRLTPFHEVGVPTMLSFTKYKGKGVSAKKAWPVVTYTRGTPRWIA